MIEIDIHLAVWYDSSMVKTGKAPHMLYSPHLRNDETIRKARQTIQAHYNTALDSLYIRYFWAHMAARHTQRKIAHVTMYMLRFVVIVIYITFCLSRLTR